MKDIEWLNNKVKERIDEIKIDGVVFEGSNFFDEGYIHGMMDVQAIANQLEALSQEWIDEHAFDADDYFSVRDMMETSQKAVAVENLQKIIIPEQKEITEKQAWDKIHEIYRFSAEDSHL